MTRVEDNTALMKTYALGQWITLDDLHRHQQTHRTFKIEPLQAWLSNGGGGRWRQFRSVAAANRAFKRYTKNRRRGFDWAT